MPPRAQLPSVAHAALLATCAWHTAALPTQQQRPLDCGTPPSPLNASTPNVLVIGDSISTGFSPTPTSVAYGYGLNVAGLLAGPYTQFYTKALAGGLATVQHGGGFGFSGGTSADVAQCIGSWIGGKQWDVITLNAGLEDCAAANPLNTTAYTANLQSALTTAAAASASVLFIATTPLPVNTQYSAGCVAQANAAAREVVGSVPKTRYIDLHAQVDAFCGSNYTSCAVQLQGDPHFSTVWTPPWPVDPATHRPLQTKPQPSGQQYTGVMVARAIQRAVPTAKIQPPINQSISAPPTLMTRSGVGGGCGLPPTPLNTSVPNMLIIGDSVSDSGSGYGPLVRAILETSTGNGSSIGGNPRGDGPLAVVQHNGGWAPAKGSDEQASSSTNGVRCIAQWLGDPGSFKWDVVSMNFGIHDCLSVPQLKALSASLFNDHSKTAPPPTAWVYGQIYSDTNTDCSWAPQYVNATAYRANLETLYTAIHSSLAPNGKLIWTSTTPIATNCTVPSTGKPGCYGVAPACVAEYNQIAADVLGGKPDVVVNDVFAAVNTACGVNFTTCSLQHEGDVHPSGPGRQFLAIELVAVAAPLLGPKWADLR